jgi:hypothetical protein
MGMNFLCTFHVLFIFCCKHRQFAIDTSKYPARCGGNLKVFFFEIDG